MSLHDHKERAAPVVRGEVIIGAGIAPFQGGAVHISLEDISFADAEADLLAETVIAGVDHPRTHGACGGATTVAFTLAVDPDRAKIDPRHDYAVRVWVDRDGDGQESPGDLYSDQSYRVLTSGFGDQVTITLGGDEHPGH